MPAVALSDTSISTPPGVRRTRGDDCSIGGAAERAAAREEENASVSPVCVSTSEFPVALCTNVRANSRGSCFWITEKVPSSRSRGPGPVPSADWSDSESLKRSGSSASTRRCTKGALSARTHPMCGSSSSAVERSANAGCNSLEKAADARQNFARCSSAKRPRLASSCAEPVREEF